MMKIKVPDKLRQATQKAKSNRLLVVATSAVSFLFLGYVIYANWAELSAYDWQIGYWELVLANIVYPATLLLVVMAWSLILHRLTKSSLRRDIEIYCLSNLTKRLPGTVWYIAGRVYLYEQDGITKGDVLSGTALEFLLLLVAGGWVYFGCLAWTEVEGWARLGFTSLALILLAGPPAFQTLLARLFAKFRRTRSVAESLSRVTTQDLLVWQLIYAAAWILGGIVLFSLAKGIYGPLPGGSLVAIIGIWSVAGLASSIALFMPSGLGVREVSLTLLLSRYMPISTAVIIALSFRILLLIDETLWTFLILLLLRQGKRLIRFRLELGRPVDK